MESNYNPYPKGSEWHNKILETERKYKQSIRIKKQERTICFKDFDGKNKSTVLPIFNP